MSAQAADEPVDRQTARIMLSRQVLDWYEDGHTLVECGAEFGISYGKAHALVKEAGGTPRRRGGRRKPVVVDEVVATPPET